MVMMPPTKPITTIHAKFAIHMRQSLNAIIIQSAVRDDTRGKKEERSGTENETAIKSAKENE
jgi:hypothetical protein